MPSPRFPQLVSLACHDLRTPLATIYGFARTIARDSELSDRNVRFVGMMEQASEQMTRLLDDLGAAARIEGGRFEPALREADTLELAGSSDEQIDTSGEGATIDTDAEALGRALESLAIAALRYGPVDRVAWDVRGRELVLSPVLPDAGPVVLGEEQRDLGAVVGRMVIEALGGSLALDGETLRVSL
ncbi:MAG TPA: histidine kinase dimerization/phospho-acceptor domain-containing protein [Gaiellaceae bacterium]|jgi:signal transduction histidine kinase